MRRTNKQELAAGLLLGAVGAAAILLSRADEMGSASQMGPAYFPTLLGAVLLLLGVLVVIRALRSGPLPLPSFAGRPLLLVLAAIALPAPSMPGGRPFSWRWRWRPSAPSCSTSGSASSCRCCRC